MISDIVAIAIPAYDEADRIGRCLDSLAAQDDPGPIVAVVVANNCSDATAAIARAPRAIQVEVVEHAFADHERGAGAARRMAMAQAAQLGTIVLTTDADCVADRDWVRAHRAAFAGGADAVAGRVSADWSELSLHPVPALRIGELEWTYLGLIAEAEPLFDPLVHDPAPRHAQRCGANLGITRAMLERVGGVPALATGEDRALLSAVELADGRIRHDRAPHVTASARLVGRAGGGMADALRLRLAADYLCDDQLVPADALVAMWRARHAARAAWRAHTADRSTFGATWAATVRKSHIAPRLRPADLPAEIDRLRDWIASNA
ncbi:glycosyltransferase [Sphingomonas sp. UYEF23]|uniref:glycosyltransferase n=1 Tax=Sphingomonas sp. UYEF23 TaxID=1756408 RepID=UPI0033939FEA